MRFFSYPAALALGAVVLLAGCRTGDTTPGEGLRIVEIESYEQLTAAIDGLDARAVVVNIWATWCGPCIAEFPELLRYDAAMEAEGVEVLFLSVDEPADSALVLQFLQQREWGGAAYHSVTPDAVRGLTSRTDPSWEGSIPLTFVFAGGELRDGWIAATTYDILAARVDRVLAANPTNATASR